MRIKLWAKVMAPVMLAGLLAGCASQDAGHKEEMKMDGDHGAMKMSEGMKMGDGDHAAESAYGEPGMASMVDRTVHITAEDNAFSIKMLNVKEGETIRFTVMNKDDTEHELVLGTKEGMAEHRAEMAKMADMDMNMAEHGAPNILEIKEMGKGDLVWKFSKAGMFEFACNIPGHYESGMHGMIMVAEGH